MGLTNILEVERGLPQPAGHITLLDGIISANTSTDIVRSAGYEQALVTVQVTAVSGTNPTLVPEIEVSIDATGWAHRRTIIDPDTEGDLTRLSAPTTEGKITKTGTYYAQILRNLGRYLRVGFTVGGTNPAFTCLVQVYLQ